MVDNRSPFRAALAAASVLALALVPCTNAVAQTAVSVTPATSPTAGLRRPPLTATLQEAKVEVVAWSAWPDMLYQGHEPIQFELTNQSDDERTVALTLARGWSEERWSVQEEITLAPGARAKVELFAPVTRLYDSAYSATIVCRGDTAYLPGLGANQPANLGQWPLIYVHGGARTPQAGAAEVWSAALASETPVDLPQVETNEEAMLRFAVAGVGPAPAPPPAGTWGVTVTPVPIEELPARFEPYTSLKGVILDAQGALPRGEVLDAMLAWTRLGGCLVFQGPDARAKALAVPGAAAWMEERFQLSGGGDDVVYACGQGAIVLAGSMDLQGVQTIADAPRHASAIQAIGRGLVNGKPFVDSPQHDPLLESVPGLSGLDLPYRALTLLLVLFAIVIGPVNLIIVKKLNRPALLLVTVPLIALVFSVGLFAYGAFAQGLGTRARAHALTWLDQRSHVATTLELRSLFAGMPAGDGWKPGPGAACIALPRRSMRPTTGQLKLDFRLGTTYGGDYLPVRREVRNAFLVDRAARARLSVTRNGERVTVENGLGVGVASLVLRDADGAWHVSKGRIDAGARAELEPVAAANLAMDRVHAALNGVKDLVGAAEPFNGTYVARLEGPAFGDACGVGYEEEESVHVVLGVLETEGG